MTLASGSKLGAYEVLSPLGAGGMGEVYRAKDLRLGREVAVKVLPEALAEDAERLSRFEQEARAASALNHPNIVTIHEIGREGGIAYIAMELVEGKTLRELEASGPMPVKKLLGIASQVAEGLSKAHAAGIVHRDLKPENVMVSKDGFVKILDFGLAKLVEPETGGVSAMPTLGQPETHPGTVMGTVAYMSPEQASGEALDFRSDQFSLGSILYEMTTGQKAFARKTPAETMAAIIREEPEPVGKLRPDLPLPVRWMLERCLAKDKEERYASTRDLARDLSSVRDHISEVSSGPEAMLAAAPKSKRRVWPLALVAAALAVGLVVGWALTRGGTLKVSAPSFQRLTFRSGIIGNARFAPDGQTVVYGAIWDGSGTDMSLYLTRPESPESRRFELRNADILAISPSGEMAILEYKTEGTSTGTLALVPMTGGRPRQVLDGVFYSSADFAPGGKDLAVVHRAQDQIRLEFPIGKLLLQGSVGSPRFSPDGSEIAFWEYQGNPRHGQAASSVDLIGREGGSKKVLSEGWLEWAGTPCWAADGNEIWFTAKKQGQRIALWAVDRSGRLRLVSRLPGALELDDVGRGGRLLLAHHTMLQSVRGRGPGTSDERELSWLDYSVPSGLSHDGKTVLLTEAGEGAGPSPAVYLRGVDGSPAVRLGDGFGLALSPDQRWVLAAAGAHLENLVLLPTGAGSPVRLETEGLHEIDGGAFTPDGKQIVFSAGASNGKHRVYALEIASGKPRAVSPEDVTLGRYSNPISPDGKWVVGLQQGSPVFFPVEGGTLRPVAGWPEGETFVGWSADGRSLYGYRWTATSIQVDVVDRESGRKRPVREIATPIMFRKVFLTTPDGDAYVYGGRRTISELYLVEGLH